MKIGKLKIIDIIKNICIDIKDSFINFYENPDINNNTYATYWFIIIILLLSITTSFIFCLFTNEYINNNIDYFFFFMLSFLFGLLCWSLIVWILYKVFILINKYINHYNKRFNNITIEKKH